MFDRLLKIITEEELKKLEKSSVLIVGIGGVGGHAAEALARSGIGRIILIDHDKVEISNKNRQLVALDSTLNQEKVQVLKERLEDINPNCEVVTHDLFLEEGNIELILQENPSFVIDACDTISTKKEIIKLCLKEKINLITSMGMGNRIDPSKLMIADIRKVEGDPLAKILKKWLKTEKINSKIKALYSQELAVKTKDKTPGSSAFVPPAAGLMLASYVFKEIIKKEL